MPRKKKLSDGIRVRGGVYYADFYAQGQRVRKRLSTQLDTAITLLNQMRARADLADFGILDNDFPIAELKEQYLKHCRQTLRPTTLRRYEQSLRDILAALNVSRVTQLIVAALLSYREERLAAEISPRTINHDVIVLCAMLRWGVKHRVIGSNPLANLKPLRNDNAKNGRPLTDPEVKALLDASPQPWRDIWYAFLVTGMRKEELASLTFDDIEWPSREIVIRSEAAKNHTSRRIPIDAGLWEILRKQQAGRKARQAGKGKSEKLTEQIQARFSRDHIFVSTQNTPLTHRHCLYGAFRRCCGLAGIDHRNEDATGREIDHVDLHSLRRTFATNLIASGADPKSVQELLGHKTLDMTMRIYAKVHAGTKRQALAKLTYGQGTLVPEGVLEYPGKSSKPVQNGHSTVTSSEPKTGN